jgi:hypothetical protein
VSYVSKLRIKWKYERSVPRCETCVNYQKPGFYLRDSLPRSVPPRCKAGGFEVKAAAVCDNWKSEKGEVLTND